MRASYAWAVADLPWQGDAVSLVDAFRRGERSPVEELRATYDAIDASDLNAFCFLDRDAALAAAQTADVSLPFGGVPLGVKELERHAGWPDTDASLVFKDRVAATTDTMLKRAKAAGAVLVGQTTASEFGGVNLTRTVLHGATHNPWKRGRTPGGSSGGSAAAVAGGLVTIATGGDGGGSIRIPAGFTGLVGLKATYGRIPRGPGAAHGNLTTVVGLSVAQRARHRAVVRRVQRTRRQRLAQSPPRRGLGGRARQHSHARAARRGRANWGSAVVSPAMWSVLEEAASHLINLTGMRRVDIVDLSLPRLGAAWSITGMAALAFELREHWPECADVLTPEIRFGLERTSSLYGTEARGKFETRRAELSRRMTEIFDQVDVIITASNPDVAFDAQGPLPDTFGGVVAGAGNNGVLTFPANIFGNPGISIPAGTVDGLPVGLQVMARHFAEPLLLDLALAFERSRPWPLVAPVR